MATLKQQIAALVAQGFSRDEATAHVRSEAAFTKEQLWDDCKAAGAALKAFPRGRMGLTPDAVKATPEWRAAKQAYDRAFAALRSFNSSNR